MSLLVLPQARISRLMWLPPDYLRDSTTPGDQLDGLRAPPYHSRSHAPVAQLDRVLASEARGRAFESRRARQSNQGPYRRHR